jgi:hypothetical protein
VLLHEQYKRTTSTDNVSLDVIVALDKQFLQITRAIFYPQQVNN